MRSTCALVSRRALLLLLPLTLVFPAGCGPQIPKTYPVKGKLVVKGGKLAKGSTIMFESVADSTIVGDGQIADDGTFTITTKMYGKSKPGAVEGEHHVRVIEPNTAGPDGQLAFLPITTKQKAKIEPRDNELTIEAVKPVPVKVRPGFAGETVR